MTSLFIRFYFGIICILVMAWLIQWFVVQQTSSSENQQVVEQALSGGVQLAIARLDTTIDVESFSQQYAAIEGDFEYPVNVVSTVDSQIPARVLSRVQEGQVAFFGYRGASYVAGKLKSRDQLLLFGPLPSFVGPSQTLITLGFGAILLLAALAIAILLRPVANQLRAVERTASAIAAGDLSARIQSNQVPKGLPLANAFNTMADRTEQLLNSQRELLQAVSHELRTPLTRIRFATDLIQTATTKEEQSQRLAAVDRATEELDELVGELLSYVRLESPDDLEHREEVNLVELTEQVIEAHRALFPAIEFVLSVPLNSQQLAVAGERNSLARAIGNLLGNAGKFAQKQVWIEVGSEGSQRFIQVDDDGPGIPSGEHSRIFEPFVRLPDSPGRGAGLGLALVARIANRHRATVTAADSPRGGARFRFLIPTQLY